MKNLLSQCDLGQAERGRGEEELQTYLGILGCWNQLEILQMIERPDRQIRVNSVNTAVARQETREPEEEVDLFSRATHKKSGKFK